MSANNKTKTLAMNALNVIPNPVAGAPRVTALKKNGGHVTGYQLADGRILEKTEAVSLAKQGGIAGVGIANRKGNEYLKSLPDGTENNNLSSLPSVT